MQTRDLRLQLCMVLAIRDRHACQNLRLWNIIAIGNTGGGGNFIRRQCAVVELRSLNPPGKHLIASGGTMTQTENDLGTAGSVALQ